MHPFPPSSSALLLEPSYLSSSFRHTLTSPKEQEWPYISKVKILKKTFPSNQHSYSSHAKPPLKIAVHTSFFLRGKKSVTVPTKQFSKIVKCSTTPSPLNPVLGYILYVVPRNCINMVSASQALLKALSLGDAEKLKLFTRCPVPFVHSFIDGLGIVRW